MVSLDELCLGVAVDELALGVAVDELALVVAVDDLGLGVAADDLGLGVAVEDLFFPSPVICLDASFRLGDVTPGTRREGEAFSLTVVTVLWQ